MYRKSPMDFSEILDFGEDAVTDVVSSSTLLFHTRPTCTIIPSQSDTITKVTDRLSALTMQWSSTTVPTVRVHILKLTKIKAANHLSF